MSAATMEPDQVFAICDRGSGAELETLLDRPESKEALLATCFCVHDGILHFPDEKPQITEWAMSLITHHSMISLYWAADELRRWLAEHRPDVHDEELWQEIRANSRSGYAPPTQE